MMVKDAIIVLAMCLDPDGELDELARCRARRAYDLFLDGVAEWIIVSGNVGHELPYRPYRTEAAAMKEYMISLGVDEKSIILEEISKDTMGNAFFTRRDILEPNGWKNIVVVTSDFHMPRTIYLFDKIFGRDYDITFEEADSQVAPAEMARLLLEERRISILVTGWLDNIDDGDSHALKTFLKIKHPEYSRHKELFSSKMIT